VAPAEYQDLLVMVELVDRKDPVDQAELVDQQAMMV
jgi:hypothetical protein